MMGDLVPSGSKYTDADRRAAVVEYIVLGNASRVAKRLNMPASTLAQWRASSWWPAMYAEHIEQVNDEILANNLRIATMAQEQLLERLENGDATRVRAGTDAEGVPEYVELRTPIKGRDLVIITGVTQDKARTQLGQPTRISSSSEGMQDLLKQFEQLAQQSREKTVVSEQ